MEDNPENPEGDGCVSQLRSSGVTRLISPGFFQSPGAGSCYARFTGLEAAIQINWMSLGGSVGVIGGVEGKYLAAELGAVDVKIDFSCGYGGVTEHHLYGIEWSSTFKEVCGKGVTQCVW